MQQKKDTSQEQGKLDTFSTDITEMARKGIDPVVGRNDEIRRVIQILLRRSKCNPMLIGEPGVGKTAIVYGLAQAIVNNDVPDVLRNCRLLSVDFTGVVAGAKYKGEFEERVKSIIDEAVASGGRDIIFIDEIHMIVGKSNDGSLDAANMLKHSLARGEIKCIGATTFNEYREYIENDQALSRRFQSVLVNEPNQQGTLAILRGLKEKYEAHHGVTILDNALVEAVRLSNLYIRDRSQPDKAIDLMDEAATLERMVCNSKPEEIQRIEDKIMEMQMEHKSLARESEDRERLEALGERIKSYTAELDQKVAKWREEQKEWQEVQGIKTSIEEFKQEAERSKREGNLERASELLYQTIPHLTAELKKKSSDQHNYGTVTRELVAQVVSKWVGVPLSKLVEEETHLLNNLELYLSQEVIGQKHAISTVANAIRRSKAGIQEHSRPMGSFLFLGGTGVGKTELAKVITKTVFIEPDAMTTIDMSEHMESHSVSRIIGAPPGYIGYDKGGGLTEKVRRRPYQLVLFDEIEKAHPDVLNILLQILDEGRITDSAGRVVSFCNTVIIMTSNVGSGFLSDIYDQEVEDKVIDVAKQVFKPEFLNRIDSIVVFHPLNKVHIQRICVLQLHKLIQRIKDNRGITLVVENDVFPYLADKVESFEWGARELKRAITTHLEYPLASFMIAHHIEHGDSILADVGDGGIVFTHKHVRALTEK